MEPVGRFFEDFQLGQVLRHQSHGPVTTAQAQGNAALTGGVWPGGPLDDVLTFNLVFGLSVADISLHAVANLGYAQGRFGVPLEVGDVLAVHSQVIGLREVSSRKAGVVYVHTRAQNQHGHEVLQYKRWVLVNKRQPGDPATPLPPAQVPELPALGAGRIYLPDAPPLTLCAGSAVLAEDQHQQLTRLFHNPARLHFEPAASPYGRCLVYGGVVIALAHRLALPDLYNGRPGRIAAIFGGAHHHPVFAGDVIYAALTRLADGRVVLWARKNTPFEVGAQPDPADPDLVLEWDISVTPV